MGVIFFSCQQYFWFSRHKAGGDLSWSTEPRTEYFVSVGCVDRRLTLPGYVGGVKKRESKQMNG